MGPAAAHRIGWIALGALGAAALLAWFFLRVEPAALSAELRAVEMGWVAAAAGAQATVQALRGARWRALLARRSPVPLGAAIAATYMSWVVLALVPGRVGDLTRPWLVARRHALDRAFAFGTQLLERLLDVGALAVLLALYLASGPPPVEAGSAAPLRVALERTQALLLVALVAALAALVAAVAFAPRLARALARWNAGDGDSHRERLLGRARDLAGGVTAIRSARSLAVAGGLTAAVWLLVVVGHLCLFRAFALDLPPVAVGPLLVFVVAGAAVPTPAAVGSYHAAVQLVLVSLFGVPLAAASAYALVSHAAAYLPNLLIGAVLFARRVAG